MAQVEPTVEEVRPYQGVAAVQSYFCRTVTVNNTKPTGTGVGALARKLDLRQLPYRYFTLRLNLHACFPTYGLLNGRAGRLSYFHSA